MMTESRTKEWPRCRLLSDRAIAEREWADWTSALRAAALAEAGGDPERIAGVNAKDRELREALDRAVQRCEQFEASQSKDHPWQS